ncbi:MAG: hypothetical protein RL021_1285 [Bacteroidota bacterium]|jgi:23S rRNA pseudouridine2604 synthase
MSDNSIRLNKFISESGLCSRREADRYIEQGNVYINGRRAGIGDQVKVGDRVRVNGYDLEPRQAEDLVFIALNKPVGVTSTTEDGVRDNIVSFVNHSVRIFPIGRLDKDSQGLIFLTNNGDLVNKILRAGNRHEKEYVVTTDKAVSDQDLYGMSAGVPMLGVTTKKCKISREAPNVFRIILVQGLNRQIRRMCEHFGYNVTKLERVRIMHITIKGLPLGEWRELTAEEMDGIYRMTADSSSESGKNKTVTDGRQKKNHRNTKVDAPAPSRRNPDNRNRSRSKHGGPKRSSGGPKKRR